MDEDVVLSDGSVARLRPVSPDDGPALAAFYTRVSPESLYLRFFGPHTDAVAAEIQHLLDSDHVDDVALVLTLRDEVVAMVRYALLPEHAPARVADVAFLVQDDLQGHGAATLLLEHLAEVGRRNGVERFVAEMLPENRAMLGVFLGIGYSSSPRLADGTVVVEFPIGATDEARTVMERRERRAESAAIRRLVEPRTVGLLGPPEALDPLEDALLAYGYTGRVHRAAEASALPRDLDLVVVPDARDPALLLAGVGAMDARALLMLAPAAGPDMTESEAGATVEQARRVGVRTLGPAALALVNTAEDTRLHLGTVPPPRAGVVGMLTQSAGVGAIMLAKAVSTGVGISTFLSTGGYADITANDVMHFWAEDDATSVCLLSLDRVGNPRKFFRILRDLTARKPVVVFTPSRALRSARWDLTHDLPGATPDAIDQVIEAAGAIVVRHRDEMFDVARILARQPVPRGRRVRVVSNSPGLVDQVDQAAARWELRSVKPHVVASDDVVGGIVEQVEQSLEDPAVDVVLPALVEVTESDRAAELAARLERVCAGRPGKPVVGVFAGFVRRTPPPAEPDGPGRLPAFANYADALQAIQRVIDGEARRTADRGAPAQAGPTTGAARTTVEAILADSPTGREATDEEALAILADHGVSVVPTRHVATLEEATWAAEELGWDVVLKATARAARGRPDTPNVSRHLRDAADLAAAWAQLERLAGHLGAPDAAAISPVVQPTVPTGIPLTLRAIEDRALGPMVCVGVAGLPSELLGDLAWRAAPLTPDEGFAMLGSLGAATILEGYRGSPPAHWFSIVDALVRLARLKDDLPEVVEADFTPVLAGASGAAIVGVRLRIAPALRVRDPLARRTT